jgi:hypothetical protein
MSASRDQLPAVCSCQVGVCRAFLSSVHTVVSLCPQFGLLPSLDPSQAGRGVRWPTESIR